MNRLSITGLLRLLFVAAIALLIGAVLLSRESQAMYVLNRQVEPGTVIGSDMVVEGTIPIGVGQSLPLIRSVDEVVGRVAQIRIEAGVALLNNFFTDRCNPAGLGSDPWFPMATEEDREKLKVFIPADIRRSGGLVALGDYVNVFRIVGEESVFLLQKVHVVGLRTADGQDSARNTDGGIVVSQPGAGSPTGTAGYVIALDLTNTKKLIGMDPTTLVFVRTDLAAADLPEAPVVSRATVECKTAPAPGASPSPSPSPTPKPSDTPSALPSPSDAPKPSPSASPIVP
jgi:hypothetical protein